MIYLLRRNIEIKVRHLTASVNAGVGSAAENYSYGAPPENGKSSFEL
jgi:hypothetical protein